MAEKKRQDIIKGEGKNKKVFKFAKEHKVDAELDVKSINQHFVRVQVDSDEITSNKTMLINRGIIPGDFDPTTQIIKGSLGISLEIYNKEEKEEKEEEK